MSEQELNSLQDANRRLCLEVKDLRRQVEVTEATLHAESARTASAAAALEQAYRHQEEFLSRLAHDLRNPLMPMQNAVELLHLPGTSAAQKQRAVDIIDGQLHNLRHILDDLLDFSRINRGKIELKKKPLDLTELVPRIVEKCRPLIERKKQQLSVALPAEAVWVHADAARLTQIVSHLLDNAAKYTDTAGRIHLAVVGAEHAAELRVEDSGIGIDPEKLPNVFDPFASTHAGRDHFRTGLGISLTKVRKLVDMHGGQVEALSAGQGQGSTFVVRLPRLSDADRLHPAAGESIDTLLKQPARRILIVTDNQEFAEEWSLFLRVAGHEVRTADHALTARDMVCSFKPEVISLDLGAGELDGAALIQRVRDLPGLDQALVIALADQVKEDSRRRVTEAGCVALLKKPVKIQDFLQVVTRGQAAPG